MLFAHSLLEARLYLKINPCRQCQAAQEVSPLLAARPMRQPTVEMGVSETCSMCGKLQDVEFAVPVAANDSNPQVINLTDDPSWIIDIGQWLTLAHLFTQQSKGERNRLVARSLAMQAADCLREALKFYDDPENDLPPASAMFTEASRRRFREVPQKFSRQRILGELRKLPISVGST